MLLKLVKYKHITLTKKNYDLYIDSVLLVNLNK